MLVNLESIAQITAPWGFVYVSKSSRAALLWVLRRVVTSDKLAVALWTCRAVSLRSVGCSLSGTFSDCRHFLKCSTGETVGVWRRTREIFLKCGREKFEFKNSTPMKRRGKNLHLDLNFLTGRLN